MVRVLRQEFDKLTHFMNCKLQRERSNTTKRMSDEIEFDP
jgi:hypothetical protein